MKTIKLDVDVRFSAYHERTGKVLVRQIHKGGRQHFRVRIYIEGADMDKVERVVYTLHPTFPEPRREVLNPPFQLVIWTWGLFDVDVEIYDREGALDQRTVSLDYSDDIREAQEKNLLFWSKS